MDRKAPSAPEQEQLRALKDAIDRADLALESLWLRYFALGGVAGPVELEAHLQGLMELSPLQCDVLAQAVNERLDELDGTDPVPYVRTVRLATPAVNPVAALAGLLDGSRLAAPERLPAAAAAAGEALGLGVVLYLVDDQQWRLVPQPPPGVLGAEALAVDGTVAGEAFRGLRVLPASAGPGTESGAESSSDGADGDGDEPGQLWVPLMDGASRLGVLGITAPAAIDLDDPVLRQRCRWLSAALGHLVAGANSRGDGLRTSDPEQARSPAAELIRRLLPPLTGGTEDITVAGMVVPSPRVAGDAFDYDLSADRVTFAIFDGAGASSGAELVTAVALSAYRTGRRDRLALAEQAAAIDETLASRFGGASLAGLLGELELSTGRLRYLVAGDTSAYVLRDGKVLMRLTDGRRGPLGEASAGSSSGEETLRRGDWLVVHTDGVADARNAIGAAFSTDRLPDVLADGFAAADPPPELVRRLAHAVLEFSAGELSDDATVLVVHWAGEVLLP